MPDSTDPHLNQVPAAPPKGPLSALAVTALVIAVLPGCPPVNLLGLVLGVLALRRIRNASGRLGGRRIAQLAVGLGWLSSMLWAAGWWWVGDTTRDALEQSMTEQVERLLVIESDRQAEEQVARWSGPAAVAPSPQEVRAFAESVRARYGPLRRLSVTSMTTDGSFSDPTYVIAMIAFFEGGQHAASGRFRLQVGTLQTRLQRLIVMDPDGGDLMIPSVAESDQPAGD